MTRRRTLWQNCAGWVWLAGPLVLCARAEPWPEGFRLGGGVAHGLVIREEGQLWGFGTGNPAALGDIATRDFPEYTTNRFLSFRIGAQSDWRWIDGMADTNGTTFAIRTDGTLWAWGDNSLGQLGDGTGTNRTTPAQVGTDTNWRTVSARAGSVFAVKSDNTLWTWGFNEPGSGSLGIGRGRDSRQYLPVRVGSASDWRTVQASRGRVETYTNVETVTNNGVVTTTNVVRSFAAGKGGAGIRGAGEIWAWGSTFARITNKTIQVVVGSNSIGIGGGSVIVYYATGTNFHPTRIGTSADWKQLVFAHEVFALKTNGTLWRFETTNGTFVAFPSEGHANHSGWSLLRSGQTGEGGNATGHVVGLKTNGTLWVWGDNSLSQVDASLSETQAEPWQIQGAAGTPDEGWRDIGAGPGYSMAMNENGVLYTWGDLGLFTSGFQRVPAPVVSSSGKAWISVVAGSDYTLGVDEDGALFGWGNTDIPDPNLQVAFRPQPIDNATNRTDPTWQNRGWTSGVSAYRRKVVAVDSGKTLRIWGDAFGDYRPDSSTNPVVIPEDLDATKPWWDPERYEPGSLSFGSPWLKVSGNSGTAKEGTYSSGNTVPEGFVAAVRGDGTLWAWGANDAGQLGDGTRIPKDLPRQVGGETNWAGTEAGGTHVLAWKRDGSLWGWGANSNGELGLTTNVVTVSNTFSGGTNATNTTNTMNVSPRVYSGRVKTTTIALASNVHRPVLVLGKGWGVRDLSAGGSHTLVLRNDGSLWSMGANDSGQLGLGALTRAASSTNGGETNTNSSSIVSNNLTNGVSTVTVTNTVTNINFVPWRVETNVDTTIDQASSYRPQRLGNKLWRSVAAGQGHSLAVRSDGTLWAWGNNASAQLGIGSLVSTNRPVQVGAGNRWVAAFAGKEHSLALQKDGTLWAWGKNDGRLGIEGSVAENPFREVSFGESGQATLTLESAGHGDHRLFGTGLVSFSPRGGALALAFQLGTPGSARAEWAGTGSYQAGSRKLIFSNLSASPASGTNSGTTNTVSATNTNASRFTMQGVMSRWWQPEVYRGTAVVDGTNCQVTILFSGDADRDGIPDFADASPRGAPPTLPSKLQVRTKVGATFQYELPSLGEGVSPIFSSSLSDLPPGLEYGSGVITGSPTREAVGTHEVVVGASNEAGESYQTLTIEVVPPDPAPSENETRIVWTNGTTAFSHTVKMAETAYAGYPFAFRAKNIPPGLVLERGTGMLRPARRGFTGVPAPGLYRTTVSVSHRGGGTGSQTLVIESLPGPSGRWQVGKPLRFQIRLGGRGATEISGIPAGWRVNPGNGVIQGLPGESGDFAMTARQRSGSGWLEENFVIGVDPAEAAEVSVSGRVASASTGSGGDWSYPAIFSMGPVATQKLEANGRWVNLAVPARSYALLWTNAEEWKWDGSFPGLATRLKEAETTLRKNQRTEMKKTVPTSLRLVRLSYEAGRPGVYLPTNHVFWLRNAAGEVLELPGKPGQGAVDFSHPLFLQGCKDRVKYLVQSGCVDGVYLPEWDEGTVWPIPSVPTRAKAGELQVSARVELLKNLREAVGDKGWIVAEATGSSWALTGPFLDGVHLVASTEPPPSWPPAEGWWPDPYTYREKESTETLWERIANSLKSFGQSGVLRRPGMVALEIWARHDLKDARTKPPRLAGLAMSLCLSDGAYLYGRPDWWQEKGKSVVSGEHLWFSEWGLRLGKPQETRRVQPEEKGFYRRQFEHGWSVYAPLELAFAKEIEFTEDVESVGTGKRGRVHTLLPGHGDLFLKKN